MPKEKDYNELFNNSYEAIRDRDDFYNLFYEKFVDSSDFTKRIFGNSDLHGQAMILKSTLLHLLDFFFTKVADDFLLETAENHIKFQIPPEIFDDFTDTLLETLDEFLPRFTSDHALAWRITLAPGIEFMKHYGDKQIKDDN